MQLEFLLFWPAWAKTLHNADLAIIAADDRTYHLINIMKKKRCKGEIILMPQLQIQILQIVYQSN